MLVKRLVWTNINPFGDAYLVDPASTCMGWTSKDGTQSALVGLNAVAPDDPDGFVDWQAGRQWFTYTTKKCFDYYHIYCIEAK